MVKAEKAKEAAVAALKDLEEKREKAKQTAEREAAGNLHMLREVQAQSARGAQQQAEVIRQQQECIQRLVRDSSDYTEQNEAI